MMKRFMLLTAIFLGAYYIQGQAVYRYNFEGTLDEVYGKTPSLTTLGIAGTFTSEVLNELNGYSKTVYRFEANSGLQFNNASATNFLGGHYTIEIYFVLDELTSWRRVIDFKNRKTDNGCYIYNGKLNFYDIVYSNDAPITEEQYSHYVMTRNGTSGLVQFYIDGVYEAEFYDTGGEAMLDVDNVLNFFQDDLIVPDEATSGAIAMLKIYDSELDALEVYQAWENLEGNVFGIPDQEPATGIAYNVTPNPAGDRINIELAAPAKPEIITIRLRNMNGLLVYSGKFNWDRKMTRTLPVYDLVPGLYTTELTDGRRISVRKVMVL